MRRACWIALEVGLICGVPAVAGDVQHYTELGVVASFSSIDEQNIETGVSLAAGNTYQQSPPGSGNRVAQLSFYAYQYDTNTGEYIWEDVDFKTLQPGELLVSQNLSRATLHTTATVDTAEGPQTVTIQLEFAATSPAFRTKSMEHYHAGKLIILTQDGGSSRDASVTGSVTGTGNWTPEPPVYASLFKVASFSVRVE